MNVTRVVVASAAVIVVLLPVRAAGQGHAIALSSSDTPRAEVGVGVTIEAPADVNQPPGCQMLGLPCLSPRTMGDPGASLMLAAHISDRVAVVAEASVSRNQWYAFQSQCPPNGQQTPAACPEAQINLARTAVAGVRVRTPVIAERRGPDLRIFGQVLLGREWIDIGPRRRAVQAGAGIDLCLRSGLIVQLGLDYRAAPGPARDMSTSRLLVSLVCPFGG